MRPKISPYEKVTIIGENGSGKSTLALGYVKNMPSAIIHDPKHEVQLPNFHITENPRDLLRFARVIWRSPGDMDPVDAGNILGEAVLTRKWTCLSLNEAALVAPGQRMGPKLRQAIITGRSLKIGVWAETQRPVDVHNLFFSEAHAYFASPNLIKSDAQKVVGFVRGYDEFSSQTWPKFTWLFYRKGEGTAQILKLGRAERPKRRRDSR
ncbi:hypothetical protein [Sulfobacillus sp. hq2]|uniref:hypothetical protein n=1 Tax=Sulfobacillus sp. hq2 TaxID=2039167 RepID=UPI000CD194D7|nr:hypothetical protein [Sulfobacillus sp. hq2]POB11433.1 hypothetical protein CO251_04630 [Sulfobacillus sp. hq2]